ncbi:uncharacterized protein SCHCODRAFT_02569644 [Schizophyllum commune H4-8]|uniref:uncharacterized protein n=1 Tax=Schizophyllum commune (strain H4-8 / FGSC 9210) TaxID=578458 RepID=UPI002160EBD2|nr:uncharacterized protein SCHCODRAFT_02569644 [Schizophyllum commune H4-8]KAI5896718.1 hypothetical protein SCHCODRAFT_02569644 [Schizophyllum commune H4-8]
MDCKRFSSDDIWRLRDGISRLTALIESKGGPVQATPDAGAQLVLDTAALRSNHDLLRAGVVPDARGEQDITDDLRAIGRLRERNLSDIVSLCSRLAQIVHQEAQSRNQEALSAAMLSPIRRLPPEILSVVFEFALTEKWKRNCIGHSSLNVAKVCSIWRATALSTPQLWKYINIDILLLINHPWKKAIETHLLRSREIPLSIRLSFYSINSVPASLQQVWVLLCAQSHRWESLTVNTIPACFAKHPWPDHFPTLSHLHYLHASVDETADFGTLADAPITSLRLEMSKPPRYVPLQLPASWRISRLEIECSSMHSVGLARYLPIISNCSTSLRYLGVSASQWVYAHSATLESTELSFLEHLKASGNGMRVCQVFTMPNLKSASLCGYASSARRYDPCFLSYFANMLRSSSMGGQLQSLTLTSLAGVWRILEECLDLLPALLHLRIEKAPYIRYYNPVDIISRSLISILVRDPGSGRSMARLPMLTHLVMKFRSARGSPMGASKVALVREVVASRSQGCVYEGTELACLERFETDIPSDWTLPMSADVV